MTATDIELANLSLPPRTAVPAQESKWTTVACRALDIVLSVVLLLALLPVFAVIAMVIRLDSPGRVFYRQRRLGRELEPFEIIKFRTMKQDVSHDRHREYVLGLIAGKNPEPDDENPMFKMTRDPRVTGVG